jgi:hypothetical protein
MAPKHITGAKASPKDHHECCSDFSSSVDFEKDSYTFRSLTISSPVFSGRFQQGFCLKIANGGAGTATLIRFPHYYFTFYLLIS